MLRKLSFCILSVHLIIGWHCAQAEVREWTNENGVSISAELVSVEADTVRIRRQSDGRVFSIPIATLSQADQAFVEQQLTPPERPLNFLPPLTRFEPWQTGESIPKGDLGAQSLPDSVARDLQQITWDGKELNLAYIGPRPLLVAQIANDGPSNYSFAVRTDGSIVWADFWRLGIMSGLPLGEPEEYIKFSSTKGRSGYVRGELKGYPHYLVSLLDLKIAFTDRGSGDLYRIDQTDPISISRIAKRIPSGKLHIPPFDRKRIHCLDIQGQKVRVLNGISPDDYELLSEPWIDFECFRKSKDISVFDCVALSESQVIVGFHYRGEDGSIGPDNCMLVLIDREDSGYFLLTRDIPFHCLTNEPISGRIFAMGRGRGVVEILVPEP